METVCNPSINTENLKKFLKINTGVDIKLSREDLCDAYAHIESGKLPLPPLILTRDRTYLIDKRSPLSQRDYSIFFSSSVLRKDLVRIARKVDIKKIDNLTKDGLIEGIGNRLSTMGIREPIQVGKKRLSPIQRVVDEPMNTINQSNVNVNNQSNVNVNNQSNVNVNNQSNVNVNNQSNVNMNVNNRVNVNTATRKPTFPRGPL